MEYLINMGARLRTTPEYAALTRWRESFDLKAEEALLRCAFFSGKKVLARPLTGALLSAERKAQERLKTVRGTVFPALAQGPSISMLIFVA